MKQTITDSPIISNPNNFVMRRRRCDVPRVSSHPTSATPPSLTPISPTSPSKFQFFFPAILSCNANPKSQGSEMPGPAVSMEPVERQCLKRTFDDFALLHDFSPPDSERKKIRLSLKIYGGIKPASSQPQNQGRSASAPSDALAHPAPEVALRGGARNAIVVAPAVQSRPFATSDHMERIPNRLSSSVSCAPQKNYRTGPIVPIEPVERQSIKKLTYKSVKCALDIFAPVQDHFPPNFESKRKLKINEEYGGIKPVSQPAKHTQRHLSAAPSDALAFPAPYDAQREGVHNALIVAPATQSRLFSTFFLMEQMPSRWPRPVCCALWKNYKVICPYHGHHGGVSCMILHPTLDILLNKECDSVSWPFWVWDMHSKPQIFASSRDEVTVYSVFTPHMVIRSYYGHRGGVYCVVLHPTLDILLNRECDSVSWPFWVCDMRSKPQIFASLGHEDTVCSVFTRHMNPQVVMGSHNSTINFWDLRHAGETMTTWTYHKKSVRAMNLHPKESQQRTIIDAMAVYEEVTLFVESTLYIALKLRGEGYDCLKCAPDVLELALEKWKKACSRTVSLTTTTGKAPLERAWAVTFAQIVKQSVKEGEKPESKVPNLLPKPQEQPQMLKGLRLPVEPPIWDPQQVTLVFCLVLPQCYDEVKSKFTGVRKGWNQNLSKRNLYIHELRLLHEPESDTKSAEYVPIKYLSDLNKSLLARMPSITMKEEQLRCHVWEDHGAKTDFEQMDYFHNMCVLHEHYNLRDMLDEAANFLDAPEINSEGRKWRNANATKVIEYLQAKLYGCTPVLYCQKFEGKNFLFEVHLWFNCRLQLLSVPPGEEWNKGGYAMNAQIYF